MSTFYFISESRLIWSVCGWHCCVYEFQEYEAQSVERHRWLCNIELGVTKRNSLGRTKVNEQYKYHEANYGFHLGFSSSTKWKYLVTEEEFAMHLLVDREFRFDWKPTPCLLFRLFRKAQTLTPRLGEFIVLNVLNVWQRHTFDFNEY